MLRITIVLVALLAVVESFSAIRSIRTNAVKVDNRSYSNTIDLKWRETLQSTTNLPDCGFTRPF